jgi:hypothetical protein
MHRPFKLATLHGGSDRRGNNLHVTLFRSWRRVNIGTLDLAVLLAIPLKDAQLCP